MEPRDRIDASLAIGAIFPMRPVAPQVRRAFSYAKYTIPDPGIASATPRFMLAETRQPPRKSFGRIRHRRCSIVLGGPGETADVRWNFLCFHDVNHPSCAHESTLARPVRL
ncbi:hypothetical protein [Burkholderia sp. Bp8998]|uniref:hypothetical protein n=1 Tax=Burkholderia sp. Bp8998 TaxID=2184557 RepID=UPI000F5B0F0B|nr:hypothetical protein [Burkholderia sp. Bp8998]